MKVEIKRCDWVIFPMKNYSVLVDGCHLSVTPTQG